VFASKDGTEADIEVRSFASSQGINEDPVCGSGNGSVAVFRHAHRLLPRGTTQYVATQGRCLGRSGRVAVRVDSDGKVELGGRCVTTVNGVLAT
jgi:PhzF family phenazine biosynthesis protein